MSAHYWEGVCIVIFLALIYKPTAKAISDYLDNYSAEIKSKVLEADNILSEAKKAVAYYEKQLKVLKTKLSTMNKHNKSNIKELKDTAAETLTAKIEQKHKLHHDRMNISRKERLQKVRSNTLARAIAVSTLYLNDHRDDKITKDDLDDAIGIVKKQKITLH